MGFEIAMKSSKLSITSENGIELVKEYSRNVIKLNGVKSIGSFKRNENINIKSKLRLK